MIRLNIKMFADTIRLAIEGSMPLEIQFDLSFSRFTDRNSITDMVYAEFVKRKLEYNRYEHIATFQKCLGFADEHTLIFKKRKKK